MPRPGLRGVTAAAAGRLNSPEVHTLGHSWRLHISLVLCNHLRLTENWRTPHQAPRSVNLGLPAAMLGDGTRGGRATFPRSDATCRWNRGPWELYAEIKPRKAAPLLGASWLARCSPGSADNASSSSQSVNGALLVAASIQRPGVALSSPRQSRMHCAGGCQKVSGPMKGWPVSRFYSNALCAEWGPGSPREGLLGTHSRRTVPHPLTT